MNTLTDSSNSGRAHLLFETRCNDVRHLLNVIKESVFFSAEYIHEFDTFLVIYYVFSYIVLSVWFLQWRYSISSEEGRDFCVAGNTEDTETRSI